MEKRLTAATGAAELAQPAPQGMYRHYVLAILTAVYVVSYIDRYVISIVLEPIKHYFNVSDSWLGILSGLGFALFYATLGIPIALWADRTNRRNIVAASLAIFSAATLACGMAVQFWHLLIARLTVGIGEAGTSPPSHSMISDLYAPHERATAMGVFAAGLNIGLMIAYFGGGWITEEFGWRYTFLAAGVPGLVLTLLILTTVREPFRGRFDDRASAGAAAPPVMQVVRYLLRRRTFIHIAVGGALNSFVGYGGSQWVAPFLARVHDMPPSQIGLAIGLIYGIAGGIGTFMGGYASGLFGKGDVRWYMWLPTATFLVAAPFSLGFYLVGDTALALGLYLLPAAAGAVYLAPTLVMTQALVPQRMRASTSAILLFVINIVGLALGPTAVGVLSDIFRPMIDAGGLVGDAATAFQTAQGLRWALVLCSLVGFWSALHFYLASRSLKADLARVGE